MSHAVSKIKYYTYGIVYKLYHFSLKICREFKKTTQNNKNVVKQTKSCTLLSGFTAMNFITVNLLYKVKINNEI